MSVGVDFTDRGLTGASLSAAGIHTCGRYLTNHTSSGGVVILDKAMTPAEVDEKTAHGVAIWSNFEDTGRPSNTLSEGQAHAQLAMLANASLGQPANRPTYFSIDYDAKPGSLDLYLAGLLREYGGNPGMIGIYSGGDFGREAKSDGYCEWLWLAEATAWQGSDNPAGFNIVQSLTPPPGHSGHTIAGVPVDWNILQTPDVGAWLKGHSYVTDVNVVSITNAAIDQILARSLGSSGPTVGVALQSTYQVTTYGNPALAKPFVDALAAAVPGVTLTDEQINTLAQKLAPLVLSQMNLVQSPSPATP